MSTPTNSAIPPPQQPTSASKKSQATHAVSTPSTTTTTLGVSPAPAAPRSLPSPVATRHHATARTPTNHTSSSAMSARNNPPTGGSGGTPMVQGLSASGISSSPAGPHTGGAGGAAAGGGGIGTGPLSMGSFGGATPNLSGLGLDVGGGGGGAGASGVGAGMIPTMSELGLTTSGSSLKRNEDEDRRERMRRVLRAIGRVKGRVSEEGIVRIARRIGLDNDIDKVVLEPEERAKVVGNRTIALGGRTTLIEVRLQAQRAVGVDVAFGMGEKVWETEGARRAGEVLLADLKGEVGEQEGEGVSVASGLDRFARNLVRLASIDRISNEGVNCFEAINGVYVCLRRLFERESEAVGGEGRKVEREVLCKRSGRPYLHENGRIGMSLDYWTSDPLPPPPPPSTDASHMDVDGQAPSDSHPEQSPTKLWSLRIDAEVCSAAMYPSLRISEDWLPTDLSLPSPTDPDQSLPWQDPPPTYIATEEPSSSAAADPMALDGATAGPKLPDLRFVAKLDPPLVVPYQTATNVLASLGLSPPQTLMFQQFHSLLLDHDHPANGLQAGLSDVVEAEQSVFVPREGNDTEKIHRYLLDVAKPEWGFKLEELPFSHPKQLVDLLPTLRQWARVADLMEGCFAGSQSRMSPVMKLPIGGMALTDSGVGFGVDGDEGEAMELDRILDSSPASHSSPATKPNEPTFDHARVDVSVELATSPHPSISFAFPLDKDGKVGSVEVQVGVNGHVGIGNAMRLAGDSNGYGDREEELVREKERVARALEKCGDVGVWIEWLRRRMGEG